MYRNLIALFMVFVLAFAIVTPALAQDGTNSNEGLLRSLSQILNRILNQNKNPQGMNDQRPFQQGMMGKEASPGAKLNIKEMEERRLSGLVKSGIITESQKQAIIAEVLKITEEINAFSKENKIDPGLVIGGLKGPLMNPGLGPQNNGQNEPNQNRGGNPQQRMGQPQGRGVDMMQGQY